MKCKRKVILLSLLVLVLLLIGGSLFVPVSPSGVYEMPYHEALHEGSRAIFVITRQHVVYALIFDDNPPPSIFALLPGTWDKENGFIVFKLNDERDDITVKAKSYWWGMVVYEEDAFAGNDTWFAYRSFGNIRGYL